MPNAPPEDKDTAPTPTPFSTTSCTFHSLLCTPSPSSSLIIWNGMKKLGVLMRKCKSLSRQLGRTSSYRSGHLRYSKSSKEGSWTNIVDDECRGETVFVGQSRRRYVINPRHLSHPLIAALMEKSGQETGKNGVKDRIFIKCEVVLFDHLLWMLENGDANNLCSDQSLEELVELYSL